MVQNILFQTITSPNKNEDVISCYKFVLHYLASFLCEYFCSPILNLWTFL